MAWPADPPSGSPLQQGIYLDEAVPPPAAWRVLLLDVAPTAPPSGVHGALAAVYGMLLALQQGDLRDVGPATVPADTFAVLLAYGASFFDSERHKPALTSAARPDHLVALGQETDISPSLPWAARSPGEADVLLQFTGKSDHAVSRAAVEVVHLIRDEVLPLKIVGSFDGFKRDDGRSWIGFHDGVSNIEPSQRRSAVECAGDPPWNKGGTYLAFLRLEIALEEWRALSRTDQELIVGRDKLSGWPIGSLDSVEGRLCPVPLGDGPMANELDWRRRDKYFNGTPSGDQVVRASHLHRTNGNLGAGSTHAAHRIFRQGYEYLESLDQNGPRLGLNFVSFQNDLYQLRQVLGLKGWLGDANFGGGSDGGPAAIALTRVRAGGFYAVPPRTSHWLPGATLFAAARV